MAPDLSTPTKLPINFELWKLQLRKDCELQDKLINFHALGDFVLRLLWERGVNPSVAAITECTEVRESKAS